jgi:toxin FitB
MLIDSNIIIYAARPEYPTIRQFIAEHAPTVSAIRYVEVLGYHKLADQERILLEAFSQPCH